MWTKNELREHETVSHLVCALAVLCAATPAVAVEQFTGFLWDEAEAGSISTFLTPGVERADQELREYKAASHLVVALATICTAPAEVVVETLTGHFWSEEAAGELYRLLEGDATPV